MKKLLRNFAILTIFACGLFTGCNNDDADIDLTVTVSTDTPSLDEPKNLGYGVLLTWRVTQDFGRFRITRQAKDGEETVIEQAASDNRYFDCVGFGNELKEGVEYTYRVYNLGDAKFVYGDNYVVKTSYAERKVTLQAGSLKKQGDKLEAVNKDNVKTSFKNNELRISFLNDENRAWGRDIVIRDAETGRKVEAEYDDGYYRVFAQKVNVEIKNVSYDGYYADSDVVKIENIENTVEERIYISNLTATVRDKTVVLLWTTKEKVEPSEFTIQRTKYNDSSKPEILKITPTYEKKYDGTYYWKAVDETVAVGASYIYIVITDYNDDYNDDYAYVSVPGRIEILNVRYSNDDNTVTLQWKAENGVSDFKIYRADGDLYRLDEDKYYDLYKPLNITFEKVDSTLDDNKEVQAVYIAKDTTVEKSKDYTYRITSTDGLDCSWNYSVRTSNVSSYISLGLYLNGSSVDYYSLISDKSNDIRLSFDDGDKNVTYKGYYTTVDNKGNESARKEFAFTNDNDSHYRKTFKASEITGLNKAVSVKFYVKCYDGDTLLSHREYNDRDERYEEVYEYSKVVSVSPSLTTYAALYSIDTEQKDYSKKEITIYANGYNFDKVIKVTYFKDDGEVKTADNLTWTKVTDPYSSYDYKATLTVAENGRYTICATVPEDNVYKDNMHSSDYYLSKLDYCYVQE